MPCFGTQVCNSEQLCEEGPTCTQNDDCVGGRVCDPDQEYCKDPCVPGSCSGFQECVDGLCTDRQGCTEDGSCSGNLVCRLAQCRSIECESAFECAEATSPHCIDWRCASAVPGACDSPNGSCAQGSDCIDGVCVRSARCQNDDDCATGLCQDNGLCSECRESADCGGATECIDGFCTERADCSVVAGDAGCLIGDICGDEGRCVVDDTCQDDLFESGTTPLEATAVGSIVHTGLYACVDASDYFTFETTTQAQVVVRHEALWRGEFGTESPDRPGLTIRLYAVVPGDSGYPEVGEMLVPEIDESVSNNGEAWVSATQPGQYIVQVERRAGVGLPSTQNNVNLKYDLEIKQSDCVLDGYEKPFRNNTPETAAVVKGRSLMGSLCAEDVDWFVYQGTGDVLVSTDGDATLKDDQGNDLTELAVGDVFQVEGSGAYAFSFEPDRQPTEACTTAPALTLGMPQELSFNGRDDFADDGCMNDGAQEAVYQVTIDDAGKITLEYDGSAFFPVFAIYDDPIDRDACTIEPRYCSGCRQSAAVIFQHLTLVLISSLYRASSMGR